MDGTIGADSAVGEGSTFWFQVPARPADRPAEDDPPGLVAKDEALRILVIDDAEMNRALAEAGLRSADHLVDCVDGGAAGVEAVRMRAYDLVLMDVRMPGMDGLAATRAIRALPFPACAPRSWP